MSINDSSPIKNVGLFTYLFGDLQHYSLENIIFNACSLLATFTTIFLAIKERIFDVSASSMFMNETTTILFIVLYYFGRRGIKTNWPFWIYLLIVSIIMLMEWFVIAGIDGVAWVLFITICAITQTMFSGYHLIAANIWNYSTLITIYILTKLNIYTIPGMQSSAVNIDYYMVDIAVLATVTALLVHIVMKNYREQHVKVIVLNDDLVNAGLHLEEKNLELSAALAEISDLREIIPICASCKNIRNDDGYYETVEKYIQRHSEVNFSHTICPDCLKKENPEIYKRMFPDDSVH